MSSLDQLCSLMDPSGPKIKSYTGTCHIINTLNGITELHNNAILYIFNVNSLYTNIPHQEGIKAIQETLAIHRAPTEIQYNTYIVELFRVVL